MTKSRDIDTRHRGYREEMLRERTANNAAVADAVTSDDGTMGKDVQYAHVAAALEAVWKAISAHNGLPVAACAALCDNKLVTGLIARYFPDERTLTPRLLLDITRLPEFMAYRFDVERAQLLWAEQEAFKTLPQNVANFMVREHRTIDSRLRLKAMNRLRMEIGERNTSIADEDTSGLAAAVRGSAGDEFDVPPDEEDDDGLG